MPALNREVVQTELEMEVQARVDAERARLRAEAGLARIREFKKPVERTFTASERDRATILFGGLTWKHEEMIKAVFHGSGYRCENIPTPIVADFQAGKEFGNNGQCNPTYFTVGNLVRYLQKLEREGLTRHEIIDNFRAKRANGRSMWVSGRSRTTRTTSGARPVRRSTSWSAKIVSVSLCWDASITTIPA
jgi:hypothetical protein